MQRNFSFLQSLSVRFVVVALSFFGFSSVVLAQEYYEITPAEFPNAENVSDTMNFRAATLNGTTLTVPATEGISGCVGTGYGSSRILKDYYYNGTSWVGSASSVSGCSSGYFHDGFGTPPFSINLTSTSTSRYAYWFFSSAAFNPNSDATSKSYLLKYFVFYWNAQTQKAEPVPLSLISQPSNLQTRFTDIAVSTATSGVPFFDIDYFIGEGEVDVNNPYKNPSLIAITLDSSIYGESRSYSINATSTGSLNLSESWNDSLADGTYTALVKFSNFSCAFEQKCPFSSVYAYIDFVISDGIVTSTTNPEFYSPYNDTLDITDYKYEDCSAFDFFCHGKNIIVWAFVPNEEYFNLMVDDLVSSAETKFPFAYFVDIKHAFLQTSSISATTTPSFTLDMSDSALGFQTPLFSYATIEKFVSQNVIDIFKAMTTLVFYITFIMYAYFRVLRVTRAISTGS